jgi:putative zinc finger/helix-turn-helix YgiT family protein
MKKETCSVCEKEARVIRGSYEFKESGLSGVTLQGIEIIACKHCKNEDPIIPRVNDLMRLLAVAVIAKPHRLVGEEVRFIRKYLGMTGDEFSRLLDIDKTSLSKWENNDDPVGATNDRLMRVMALALDPALREKLDEVIRTTFPQLSRKRQPKHVDIEINPADMSYQYA